MHSCWQSCRASVRTPARSALRNRCTKLIRPLRAPGNGIVIDARNIRPKEGRDIGGILPLTQNPIIYRHSARGEGTIMKPKKLKKRIQQLEKRVREGSEKLARLRRKLQEAETAKALKAARKSAARVTASAGKKPKRKLNLSPERRAQLAAAMKARWAAKRAAEGNSATSSDQNSPAPPIQPPENRGDGV